MQFHWNGITWQVADFGGGKLSGRIDGHRHSKDSYELHFITGGQGTLETDTAVYRLQPGDFFVTGPNVYHAQASDKAQPVEDIFIYLQKVSGAHPSALAEVFLATHFCFVRRFSAPSAATACRELREKKPGFETAAAGLLMQLLTDIVRLYLPADFWLPPAREVPDDKRLIILENAFLYEPNLTLRALSEKLGLCERQTQRLLKKYYGKTFRQKAAERKKQSINIS